MVALLYSAPMHKCLKFLNSHNFISVNATNTELKSLCCAWSGYSSALIHFLFEYIVGPEALVPSIAVGSSAPGEPVALGTVPLPIGRDVTDSKTYPLLLPAAGRKTAQLS